MAYLEVADSDLDADSPLTETLMIQMNDNTKSLKANEITNGNTHDHAGGDGNQIPTAGIVDEAITHTKNGIEFRDTAIVSYGGTGLTNRGLGLSENINGAGSAFSVGTPTTTESWRDLDVDIVSGYTYYDSPDITQTSYLPVIKGRVRTGTDANTSIIDLRMFWGLFSNTGILTDATPDEHCAFFRYDDDEDGTAFWRAVTIAGTGASAETTTTTVAVAQSTEYKFEIRCTSTEITFYIADTLVATHNTIVPTSTTGLDIKTGVVSLDSAGTARGIGFHSMEHIKDV